MMRTLLRRFIIPMAAVVALAPAQADPLDLTFTYQGLLELSGSPANGEYDFRFELFDALDGGAVVGAALDLENVSVTDGVFSVELDFGPDTFAGEQFWLEISVRYGASTGGYQGLAPRQKLSASPNALYSETASFADAASFADEAGNAATADSATTAASAAFADEAGNATTADSATTAATAAFADEAGNATTADSATTAATATFADEAGNATTADSAATAAFADAVGPHTHDALSIDDEPGIEWNSSTATTNVNSLATCNSYTNIRSVTVSPPPSATTSYVVVRATGQAALTAEDQSVGLGIDDSSAGTTLDSRQWRLENNTDEVASANYENRRTFAIQHVYTVAASQSPTGRHLLFQGMSRKWQRDGNDLPRQLHG